MVNVDKSEHQEQQFIELTLEDDSWYTPPTDERDVNMEQSDRGVTVIELF